MRAIPIGQYPPFGEAVERFRSFLSDQGHSADIKWVFRNDIYADHQAVFVTLPLPEQNLDLAARAYAAGMKRDQVEIRAISTGSVGILATIWYPITDERRLQGWESGLRLAIVQPLKRTNVVCLGWRWRLHKLTGRCRRYHAQGCHTDLILSRDEVESTTGKSSCSEV